VQLTPQGKALLEEMRRREREIAAQLELPVWAQKVESATAVLRAARQALEIGFGPGRLIELIAPLVPQGLVAGVDPSEVMVRQATRGNEAWIRAGRVALLQGSVSALPWRDREFSQACAVNAFQFWPRPLEDLRELRRVLQDGGHLLICLRRHEPQACLRLAPGLSDRAVEEIRALMEKAGF
jgi:ubiquinone/menaquinone biosynthesis C-methylase UbiE